MLTIIIPGDEIFDEVTQEFSTVGDVEVKLEHSLVSLSKWESIYEKPFLSTTEKTSEEIFGYINCMIVGPEIAPEVFSRLSKDNLDKIHALIEAKMTATWITEVPGAPKDHSIVTSELIYYWMISFQIPMECENWHLNRLFTLIRICNIKNAKPRKMSKTEAAAQMRAMNAKRKAELKTSG